jgi:hypothetical protein
MKITSETLSRDRFARMAGLMYLLVIAAYVAADRIRSHIDSTGSFVEIAHRIAASEHLYRLGLVLQIVEMLLTLWLAVGLYVTVRPINRNLAVGALASRMAEVILGGAWILLEYTGTYIRLAANHGDGLSATQYSALAAITARTSSAAYNSSAIFFSMGSTVFFYLFLRSQVLPKWMSWFGLAASVLVTAVCLTKLIAPEYSATVDPGWMPMGIAEVVTGLWLLFRGAGKSTGDSEATA